MLRRVLFVLMVLLTAPTSFCNFAPAFADDPCQEPANQVKEFVVQLNRENLINSNRGIFKVIPLKDEGVITRYSIKYDLSGKILFQRYLAALPFGGDPLGGYFSASAHQIGGTSALIFDYQFGNAIHCRYAVFARSMQFAHIRLPDLVIIKDLNGDKKSEILAFEPETWAWGCGFARGEVVWPRILQLDSEHVRLEDVSFKFPNVYKEELRKYEAKEMKERTRELDAQCRQEFSNYIERLKQASVKR